MKIFIEGLLTLVLVLASAMPASAQTRPGQRSGDYPDRPLRLMAPFPPSGASDIFIRILAQRLGDALHQQVVIDNRPGAGGNIAAEIVMRASPDGYTLLLSTLGNAIYASLTSKPSYDLARNFDAVTQMTSTSFMLFVNPSVQAASIKDLIALAKAKPNSLNYGSSGIGGPSHLAMELFLSAAQISAVHVPYQGAGPAMPALTSGEIQMMFTGLATAQSLLSAGKLRVLAIGRLKRLPAAPDVPTLDESGLKGLEVNTWYGLNLPAGTPRSIVTALNRETVRVLREPATAARFESLGFDLVGSTPQEFAAYVRAEIAKWAIAVKKSGARMD